MEEFPRRHWKLDHIGHAVSDMEAALRLYVQTLGFSIEERETLTEQKIEVVFCRQENTLIELIAPLGGNSSITKFLKSRGPGLHHICFHVPSVQQELQALAAADFTLIDSRPRPGSRNLAVAFVHPHSCAGVLIELCGSPE
jgi:methylmalonyl-CoA epimerase